METSYSWTDETAWVSSDERKIINKIKKLASDHPDEVHIMDWPEDNDGCIYATVPADWIRIQPKRVLSEEERAKKAEQARRVFKH